MPDYRVASSIDSLIEKLQHGNVTSDNCSALLQIFDRYSLDNAFSGEAPWSQIYSLLGGNILNTLLPAEISLKHSRTYNEKIYSILLREQLKVLANTTSFAEFSDISQVGKHVTLLDVDPGNVMTMVADILEASIVNTLHHRIQALFFMYVIFNSHRPDENQVEGFFSPLRPYLQMLLRNTDLYFLTEWLNKPSPRKAVERWLRLLSGNLFFPVKFVNFRLFYRCNAQCRHCYNNSGKTDIGRELQETSIYKIIDEAVLHRVPGVLLSGGEPFLALSRIKRIIRYARQSSIRKIGILTNGFWAKSLESTESTLNELKSSGFSPLGTKGQDFIRVSGGDFHQEFIPRQNIVNVATIYHHLFGKKLFIDYETYPDDSTKLKDFKQLISRAGLSDCVEITSRRVMPIGRGANLPYLSKGRDVFSRSCNAMHMIVFNPDGSARPCCGLNDSNSGIIIGHIQDGLKKLLASLRNDPVLQFIASRPFGDFFTITGEVPIKDTNSLCSLCQSAIGNCVDRERLRKAFRNTRCYFPYDLTNFQADL